MARAIDASELMAEIQACSWDSEQDKERAEDLVLGMPTLTPPNEPLTIEQLREMDGEPAYCCTVQRSKDYHTMPCIIDCGRRAPEIRRPEDQRCELFELGDFKTRFRKREQP